MLQERLVPAFSERQFQKRMIMHVTLLSLLRPLAGIIMLSHLSFAACTGAPHQTGLAGYALSPDNSRIAAIAEDGSLFWWDVVSRKRTELSDCVQLGASDHPIIFGPDSNRLAISVNSAVHVFDVSTGKVIARLTSPKLKEIYKISFSDNGRRLAASYAGGAVVWDVASEAEITSISAHPNPKALALNRDGTLLVLGCWDGLVLSGVFGGGIDRKLLEGVPIESALFVRRDKWIVALTATPLARQPNQRLQKYTREIAVWDSTSGKKLKSFEPVAELDELPFGLTNGGPHLLLAADLHGRLLEWDLDTGKLDATWKTPSGHPSADAKLLLREGETPGQLELWEIGGPNEKVRAFAYKSPLCAENFVDANGKAEFDNILIADGVSDEGEPLGSLKIVSYVAQDCTRVNVTHLTFKTEERARLELDHEIAQAIEVFERVPPEDEWSRNFLGRTVLRFPRRDHAIGFFAVMRIEGTSLIEIDSSSLPVALAMEKQMWEKE